MVQDLLRLPPDTGLDQSLRGDASVAERVALVMLSVVMESSV